MIDGHGGRVYWELRSRSKLLPVPRWVRYTSVSRYTTLPFFKCTNRICRKRTHYDRANAFGREFEISIMSHKSSLLHGNGFKLRVRAYS
jgi:hypothetical protein